MAGAFDDLKREVTEMKSVVAGTKALLVNLSERIRAGAGNEAEMRALATELDETATDLSKAVADNTPVEGEDPPPSEEV